MNNFSCLTIVPRTGKGSAVFLIRYKSITEICHYCQYSSFKDKDQQLVWGPLIVSWCLSESMTQRWRDSPKGLHLFHTPLLCGNVPLSYQPHKKTLSSSQSREGDYSLQVYRNNINNNFIYMALLKTMFTKCFDWQSEARQMKVNQGDQRCKCINTKQ